MAQLAPFKPAPYGIVPVSAIKIDYERDKKLTPYSLAKLEKQYLRGLKSPQDRFAQLAAYYAYDEGHAQRLYDRISNLHFMPATPVLSNGGTPYGLPASCFLNEALDTLDGLADLYRENMFLAARGGGIGSYWGQLRSIGESVGKNGHTSGVIPFIRVMDSLTLAISQGCVPGDTEILTEEGFVRFDALNGSHGKVWQVDERGVASLVTVEDYHVYDHAGEMHHYVGTDRNGDVVFDQTVTPGHRMVTTTRGYLTDKFATRFDAQESQDIDLTSKASFVYLHGRQCADIIDGKWLSHELAAFDNTERTSVPYTGKVYCVTVPSGMFIIRSGGVISVTGNSLRRGSAAVYLPIWHPEVEEFIETRRPTGGDPNRKTPNLHHGVTIPNAFMRKVMDDGDWDFLSPKDGSVIRTVKARDLWIRLLTARLEQGEPYILYVDNITQAMPQFQKDAGLTVKTSNLCVHGDTKILTRHGEFPIKALDGQTVEVWNGNVWSKSVIAKTADDVIMRRIVFSNGNMLTLTDHHKFYVDRDGQSVEVRAADLKLGDRLETFITPDGDLHSVSVTGIVENVYRGPSYCANEPLRHRIILNGIETGNCSEITLPTGLDQYGKNRTAVCYLASPNLETYDEWAEDDQFYEDIYYFMDAVVQDLIDNAPPALKNAVYGSMRERSVGVGCMGFHTFFQQKNIPFESAIAKSWNMRIFKKLRYHADRCSRMIALERGSCPDAEDMGVVERFACKIAIAPTASISIICGETSPGIDPIIANLYDQKTLSGTEEVKNKYFVKLLQELGKDTPEVWTSIRNHRGSVQQLDFLTQDQKDVYKTAFEIDQRWVVEHAADRTPYICQSQPVNLWLPPTVHKRDLHGIHMLAWEKGLKSLYYCRSHSIRQADAISGELGALATSVPEPVQYDECLACQ